MTQRPRFRYDSVPYGWFPVLYSDELPVGGVIALDYFEQQMVAWRDDRGAAHVFDAACPHYGAHLGYGGRVEDDCLRCPFHGIRYDADGRRIIASGQDATSRGEATVLPTIERNEQVHVWYHPAAIPPTFDVPEIPELLSGDFTGLEYRHDFPGVNTAWHMIAEQVVDFSHFVPLHNIDLVGSDLIEDRGNEFYVRVVDRPELTLDSWYFGPGVAFVKYAGAVDAVMCATTLPTSPTDLTFRVALAVRRQESQDDTDFLAGVVFDGFLTALHQDMQIMEHQTWLEKPALVPTDGDFVRFRRWAARFHDFSVDSLTSGNTERLGLQTARNG